MVWTFYILISSNHAVLDKRVVFCTLNWISGSGIDAHIICVWCFVATIYVNSTLTHSHFDIAEIWLSEDLFGDRKEGSTGPEKTLHFAVSTSMWGEINVFRYFPRRKETRAWLSLAATKWEGWIRRAILHLRSKVLRWALKSYRSPRFGLCACVHDFVSFTLLFCRWSREISRRDTIR